MEKRHLFEREMQHKALEEFDDLAHIKVLVDWDAFVPQLTEIYATSDTRGGPGRPASDALVIFRSILFKVMYSLSDCNLQFMLLDRRTCKQFAGLKSDDQVSNQKTLWKYKDQLSRSGRIDEQFELFKAQLLAHGYEFRSGQLSIRRSHDCQDASPAQQPRRQ